MNIISHLGFAPRLSAVSVVAACGSAEASYLFAQLAALFKQASWSSFRFGNAEKRMLLLDGEKPLMALCQSTQRSALPVFAQIVAETPEGQIRRAVRHPRFAMASADTALRRSIILRVQLLLVSQSKSVKAWLRV